MWNADGLKLGKDLTRLAFLERELWAERGYLLGLGGVAGASGFSRPKTMVVRIRIRNTGPGAQSGLAGHSVGLGAGRGTSQGLTPTKS